MYTINNLNVFSDTIEGKTLNVMHEVMRNEWVIRGVLLPDAHFGMENALPIGGVAATLDVVVPSWVGYDIGCFTGDTKVRLIDGTASSFIELYTKGEKPFVFCCDNDSGKIKIQQATVHKTKTVDELIEITLDNEEVITCTLDHEFQMREDLKYVRADRLVVGSSLSPLYLFEDSDGYLLCQNNLLLWTNNKGDVWESVHRIVADECNIFDATIEKPCIHHVDQNRKNNYPNNLVCMSVQEHMSLHGKQRGWFKTTEFKEKRKIKLEENGYYNPIFYDQKKRTALTNMVKLQQSEGFKNTVKEAGQRGKKYLKNSDSSFIQNQQESKVAKILNLCMQNFGVVSLEKYNIVKKNFHNPPGYDKAFERIQKGGYASFQEFFAARNHKVIAIRRITSTQDVFCLNVPKYHNFALASGVFVHNCGMCAVKTKLYTNPDVSQRSEDILKMWNYIYTSICNVVPLGVGVYRNKAVMSSRQIYDKFEIECSDFLMTKMDQKMAIQLGSLGSGNHFIEIGVDSEGFIWVIIHSGSRGIGHACATHYMGLAQPDAGSKEGSFPLDVNSIDGKNYIKDLAFMLEFALSNRAVIMNDVLNCLFYTVSNESFRPYVYTKGKDQFVLPVKRSASYDPLYDDRVSMFINRNHNHAELKDGLWIHRKGATHAEVDMFGVIPGNMRDGSFIVKGKGNPDSLCSSSHGAGRVLGRNQAKKTLDVLEFVDTMKGIVCGVENNPGSLLDEAPAAYKDIFTVMDEQKDLVDIVEHVKPLINVKR
jgi:tRNA-splicing ligase RtcB (3'-phosphate/5'-hydroxy nucleic acid ligase)